MNKNKIAPHGDDKIKELLEIEAEYYSVDESERSQKRTAIRLGTTKDKVRHGLNRIRKWREKFPNDTRLINREIVDGSLTPKEIVGLEFPKLGKIKTYILTSVQNNTKIHKKFFENLVAYTNYLNAELFISTFTYSHNNNGEFSVKRGTSKKQDTLWWPKEVEPYISDDRIQVAKDLVWCGDFNILPTHNDPVSALDSFNGMNSNIFPHVKMRQKAIASQKGEPVKRNITTGTISQLNYVQRKAGMKAEFDHVFGALIVTVDSNGEWNHRQIIGDSNDGSFYDLTTFVADGSVNENVDMSESVIVHGDIHAFHYDLYGDFHNRIKSFTKKINPKYQVLHDVLDFRSRNSHDEFKYFENFKKFQSGFDNVEDEIDYTADVVSAFDEMIDGETLIAYSNHDDQIYRWLNGYNGDFRRDHLNAIYYLELMRKTLISIRDMEENFSIFEYAIRDKHIYYKEKVKFMGEDDTFKVHGIEIAKHGHLGASGSRGSLNQFANYGIKCVVGHYHKGEINKGAYSVGVLGNLEMGYNKGYSCWTHTSCLIYPNGKRTLIDFKI